MYYDSLKAFSPAGFNAMTGVPFPGDPDRYPARDEVADYLDSYAATLDVEIHTHARVLTVGKDGRDFVVVTADGRRLRASGIVAASGSFSAPYRPAFPGQDSFTGELAMSPSTATPPPTPGSGSSWPVRATRPRRWPTSWRPWQGLRLPRGTRLGSFRSGSASRTCTLLAGGDRVRLAARRVADQDHRWQRDHRQRRLPADPR